MSSQRAADPGLVFNSGWNNWLAFLCGTSSCRRINVQRLRRHGLLA